MHTTWREELAWCAGFFDGEGWVGAYPRADHVGIFQARLTVTQVDRRALDRFRRAVLGVGGIWGPYTVPGGQPRYQYHLTGFHHVQSLIAMIWPWLGPVKREQAHRALLGDSRRPLVGTASTCRRGHPMTEANARIYYQGVRHYKSRACRTCNREAMRHWRLMRRTALALLTA